MRGTQLLAPAATAGSAADEAFVRATARPAPRRSATRAAPTSAAIVISVTSDCRLRLCLARGDGKGTELGEEQKWKSGTSLWREQKPSVPPPRSFPPARPLGPAPVLLAGW